MSKEELDELIGRELQQWGIAVLQRLSAKIREQDLVLTGDLLKSLQYEVLKTAASGVVALQLSFEQSGRMKDMNRLNQRKLPPIERIEEFVREVGVNNFAYVPGYISAKRIPTESEAVKRIAWGIARSRQMDDNHKPKKWFARPFYSMIDPLITKILIHYQEATLQAITGSIKIDNGS